MARVRSVVVVALIWMAAFAASSIPDGLGGAPRAGMNTTSAGDSPGSDKGKRWAVMVAPAQGPWDVPAGGNGKRWD